MDYLYIALIKLVEGVVLNEIVVIASCSIRGWGY